MTLIFCRLNNNRMLKCILIQNKKILIEHNKLCIIIVNFNQLINQQLKRYNNHMISNQRLFQNICFNKYYLIIKIIYNQRSKLNKLILIKKLIVINLHIGQKVIVFYKIEFKYFQKMLNQNKSYMNQLILDIQNLMNHHFI